MKGKSYCRSLYLVGRSVRPWKLHDRVKLAQNQAVDTDCNQRAKAVRRCLRPSSLCPRLAASQRGKGCTAARGHRAATVQRRVPLGHHL
jgi:hypothetical protein